MRRVAVVTGGAGGIGREICRKLLEQHTAVVAVGRSREKLAALAEELGGLGDLSYVPADVTKSDDVRQMVNTVQQRYGGIGILVNCVGGSMNLKKDIQDIEENEWHNLMDSNLTSVYLCCRFAIPLMKQVQWGRVINVSSIAGRSFSYTGSSAYAAAKAGILGLTRQVACEVASSGITVNAIAPGLVNTERVKKYWLTKTVEEQNERLKMTPLKRPGEPGEIASAVVYLCSEEASYITGVVLDINGGIYMG